MTQITFKDLGLSDPIVTALEEKGFQYPTPIQERAIPHLLNEETDIVGQAETGTGKTAAFALPILDQIDPDLPCVQALIITPTRELTLQVSKEIQSLCGRLPYFVTPVYGGQPIQRQIEQLRKKTHIVVGTPGRLIDLMKSKKLDVSRIAYLVLDEADEMLNRGFLEDIEWILEKTNPDRKTLLFSATMPPAILKLAKGYMKDPVTINARKQDAGPTLTQQSYIEVREQDKLEVLCRLMDVEAQFYGIIFCRTKRDVDATIKKLTQRGYLAEAIHGDITQMQRESVLERFRNRICRILVATDVASRGLDIPDLTHVVNYAIPEEAETYVHRVGRTGRAGKTGMAITLITPQEFRKLKWIERDSKMEIRKAEVPTIESVVESKKSRVAYDIEALLRGDIEEEYAQFASRLMSQFEPEEALGAVLKLAFETAFSDKHYTQIKTPERFSKENNGGGYKSRRGGGSGSGGGGGYSSRRSYGSGAHTNDGGKRGSFKRFNSKRGRD